MELELQADLREYISPKSLFYREMMLEYFTRLRSFSGVDEFGNSLEEVPVSSLISPTFNQNVLVQAVNEAAKLYRDFNGLLNSSDAFQQFTVGAPYIKDEILYNAYSLPIKALTSIFTESLKGEQDKPRPIVHISKSLQFYFEGRSHDVIYQPMSGGLPRKIIQLLYDNFKKKPITSGGLIHQIDSKKKLFPQDITSCINDINETFSNSSKIEVDIIINNSGYLLNDRHFDFLFD